MGHERDFVYSEDGYSDITGTDHALGATVSEAVHAAMTARWRAAEAQCAATTVQAQAIRALSADGHSVRDIARMFDANGCGLSKSAIAREVKKQPWRAQPDPQVDQLVADLWSESRSDSQLPYTIAPRPGDRARSSVIEKNIFLSLSAASTGDTKE